MTKYPAKRAQDALRRAERNVRDAIGILQVVSENGGLTSQETLELKEILSKCQVRGSVQVILEQSFMPCGLTKEEIGARKQQLVPLIEKADRSFLTKRIEKCNTSIFYDFRVKQAKSIISKAIEIFSGKLPVAFSGGKDSLVVLHLALELDPNIHVIYNNTTVEFPETLQYVKQLQDDWGFSVHVTKCSMPFFKMVEQKGWALHEDRWCCKPYKDEPAFQYIARATEQGTWIKRALDSGSLTASSHGVIRLQFTGRSPRSLGES